MKKKRATAYIPAYGYWLQPIAALKPFSWLLPRSINNANHEFLGLKRDLLAQAGRLYEITIPVSAVHGDMDSLVPAANSYYLQQKLVNAALDMEILKQKDHFIPWSSKSVIDQSLERLIERVRRTEQQGCR